MSIYIFPAILQISNENNFFSKRFQEKNWKANKKYVMKKIMEKIVI